MPRLCCAFLGHYPMRFRWGWDEEDYFCIKLKTVLLQQIQLNGFTQFMTTCDPGVGLWCAEMVNVLRDSDGELQLFVILPHEEQATKGAPYLQERYFEMLRKCTYMMTITPQKTKTSQRDAFEYIIDNSDIVLAVYDPQSIRGDDVDFAMGYAKENRRPMILVHPDTLDIEDNIT